MSLNDLAETLSGSLADGLLRIGKTERIGSQPGEVALGEKRVVEAVPRACNCQITNRIMVRRIVPVRTVSPSVPVPPVAVVERHHVIVQKIRRAAPAGACQCRFGGHCVAFEKPGVRPQC